MAQAKRKTAKKAPAKRPAAKAKKPAPRARARRRPTSEAQAETREIFDHYDHDRNGWIDRVEFTAVCEALGADFSDGEVAAGWNVVDADGNGRISWKEFSAWWSAR